MMEEGERQRGERQRGDRHIGEREYIPIPPKLLLSSFSYFVALSFFSASLSFSSVRLSESFCKCLFALCAFFALRFLSAVFRTARLAAEIHGLESFVSSKRLGFEWRGQQPVALLKAESSAQMVSFAL